MRVVCSPGISKIFSKNLITDLIIFDFFAYESFIMC